MRLGTSLIACVLTFLVAGSCPASKQRAAIALDSRSPRSEELAIMNFAVETRPVSAQVDLFTRLGYTGVAFFHSFQPDVIADFRMQPAVTSGRLPIVAVLYTVDAASPDHVRLKRAIESIAQAGGVLWLLVDHSAPVSRTQIVDVVREAADIAASTHPGDGFSLVLYPHLGQYMASAEIALGVLLEAGRPNIGLSLHLCHELKAGNRDRLAQVIAAVSPFIALASIHGADRQREDQPYDWSRTIMPLAAGDLDVEHLYLRPLLKSGYKGPILLHTFGLSKGADTHLKESRMRWEQMIAAWSGSR